jgi:peptide/nickel transport system permease protein
MSIVRFATLRLLRLIGTLLVSSFVIFSSLYLAPGNPLAALSGGRTLPPESVAILEKRFHLNDSFFVRYFRWLGGILRGDFGISIKLREDVSKLITARIGTTLSLVLFASILILVIGIGAGVVAALKPGRIDSSILIGTALSAAIPSFVATTLLLTVFVLGLGWFPSSGDGDGFFDTIHHLTLPAIALAFSSLAIVARITRSAVREELGREHVQTATSRGLPPAMILRKHVLRNAAIPITTVSAVTIASLLALASVVERAFSLNGLGSYLVSAAATKDFAVVQGISMVIVAAFTVTNTVVDLLYAVLDPRIALGSGPR